MGTTLSRCESPLVEALPAKYEKECILLVLVYHALGRIYDFVDVYTQQGSELPRTYVPIMLGNFNLDERFNDHVEKLNPLLTL